MKKIKSVPSTLNESDEAILVGLCQQLEIIEEIKGDYYKINRSKLNAIAKEINKHEQ